VLAEFIAQSLIVIQIESRRFPNQKKENYQENIQNHNNTVLFEKEGDKSGIITLNRPERYKSVTDDGG